MKYFNEDGRKKFYFSVASLTREAAREMDKEYQILLDHGIVPIRRQYRERANVKDHDEKSEKVDDNFDSDFVEEKEIKECDIHSLELNENADFLLYYIRYKYNNRFFYKIGVTRNSLEERFGKDLVLIDKVLFCKRVVGALNFEKKAKKIYKNNVFPLALIKNGNTEIFDIDVLQIDEVK
jgi:hypothetical protein